MTLRAFSCLSDAGKDEVVTLWGDVITEKLIPGYKIILYKVDSFFVEVYYDLRRKAVQKCKGCLRSDLLYTSYY
jgi:hypothetical protein